MPIYEYKCQDCGAKFESLRHMRDADAPIQCASCSSTNTKRVLSTCYTKREGASSQSGSSGCAGCSGGSCSSCGH